jgi:hypothetical protein
MSPRNRRSSREPQPESSPAPEERRDPVEPGAQPGNGALAEETEAQTALATEEEPAQVQLTIKGSDKSAREAAKRFGGEPPARPQAPQVETPADDPEDPPEDPIAALLSDGRNMVVVTRQTPRNIRGPRGEKIATNVRLPGRYTCPTTIAAIAEQVFDEHWGSTYKCTIHPDTSTGENKILGHFTIEHPDPEQVPYVEGVTDVTETPPEDDIPTEGDPTLRETDTLAQLKIQLQRRLERANMTREIKELERQVKELENEDKPKAPQGENDEVRRLREENERYRREAEAKKNDDRFMEMQRSISDLAKSVAALAAAPQRGGGEETSVVKAMLASQEKMFSQSQQHSKEMLDVVKSMSKPTGTAVSAEDNFDKMLERLSKMKSAFGSKDSRVSQLEDRLIEASIERMMGGGDDDSPPAEEEDAWKYALKQMTPVIKAYVEKKVDNRGDDAPPVSKEELKKAYEEAGAKAAKEVAEKWQREGLVVRIDPKTGQPAGLPAPNARALPPRQPHKQPVERITPEGKTKTIHVQPTDLSGKPKPKSEAAPAEAPEKKGETVAKFTEMPGLGPNGETLKVELPSAPGDMKYDRTKSLNFVLDSIRSEIRQEIPTKNSDETVVPADALELLDEEVLDMISNVDSGEALEKVIGPFCDATKLTEIKEAGRIETNASWLRRVFLTIRDHWRDYKVNRK